MIAGSRNSVSSVENAIANVLLNASGLKRRPSRAPRKKIGRNEVTMISIENSSGRVILAVARMIVSLRSAAVTSPRRASSAVQFSTITIVASAISPMAIERPASANRLIVWSNADSGSAVNSVPSRRMDTGATAARTFFSASAMTTITTISS